MTTVVVAIELVFINAQLNGDHKCLSLKTLL